MFNQRGNWQFLPILKGGVSLPKLYELSKAPFDVNVAKMIQDGEIDGEIITTDGQEVRVIRWDFTL